MLHTYLASMSVNYMLARICYSCTAIGGQVLTKYKIVLYMECPPIWRQSAARCGYYCESDCIWGT